MSQWFSWRSFSKVFLKLQKLQKRLDGPELHICSCCVYLQPQPLRYHPHIHRDEDDSLLAVIDDEGAAIQASVDTSGRLPRGGVTHLQNHKYTLMHCFTPSGSLCFLPGFFSRKKAKNRLLCSFEAACCFIRPECSSAGVNKWFYFLLSRKESFSIHFVTDQGLFENMATK